MAAWKHGSIFVVSAMLAIVWLCWFCLCGCYDGAAVRGGGSDSRTKELLSKRVDKVIAESLSSKDSAMRCHGLELVALRGGLSGPGYIRQKLCDAVGVVRFSAAVAAGDIKDHTARGRLEQMLDDPDVSVKLAVGYGLERLGDKRFSRWYDHVLFGDDAKLCAQACMLLGKLGNTPMRNDSAEVLWRVLRKKGQKPVVRLEAAESLARLGDERIIKRLIIYASSAFVDDRLRAISGLELIGGSDAYSMLTVLADDMQVEVQLAAMRAMGDIGDVDLAKIRGLVGYNDPHGDATATARVRGLALLALGSVGGSSDGYRLYEAMGSKVGYLRVVAAKAAITYLKRTQAVSSITGM